MEKELKRVAIVHHTYTKTSLVEEELLNYLLPHTNQFYYISLPFKQARDQLAKNVRVRLYKQGIFFKEYLSLGAIGSEISFFIRDLLFTVFYFLFKPKLDIFFGVDNLNAFCGILLKKLGKVSTVVYYVIDYVPQRFSNPVLNTIYRQLDLFCVKYADQTWNLSEKMSDAREAAGLAKQYRKKQVTVPVGAHSLLLSKATSKRTWEEKKIVFLGIHNHEQGVDLLLPAFQKLQKKIKNVSLIIVGSGELTDTLKKQVKELQLQRFVTFTGFIDSNAKVDQLLLQCHVGLAPYRIEKHSFKQFTDPGKIKTYLGAGVPIVMSNISHIAKQINRKKAGIVVQDNIDELAKALITLLSNEKTYNIYQKNAAEFSLDFDWTNIFKKAFRKLP